MSGWEGYVPRRSRRPHRYRRWVCPGCGREKELVAKPYDGPVCYRCDRRMVLRQKERTDA